MSNASASAPQPGHGVTAAVVRAGLVCVMAIGLFWWFTTRVPWVRWADVLAVGVSFACVLSAARVGLLSFNPAALGKRMELEGDSTAGEARQARLQSLMLFLLAVVLLMPAAYGLWGWPDPRLAYGAVVVFVALRIAYTWHIFRTTDEFVRRRIQRGAWGVFFVFQSLLLLWAAGERLGLLVPLDGWDALVLLTTLTLFVPSLMASLPKPAG